VAYSEQCESFKALPSLATEAEKFVVLEHIPLRVNKTGTPSIFDLFI
jgi:hypothetical protein